MMLIATLLTGCSSSNNSTGSTTELRNCIVALEPAFKVERTAIYDQFRSIISRSQVNLQDPSVTADLVTITGEINKFDQVIQGATCQNGGFDYLRTVQGISSGMKSAINSFSQGIANQNTVQIGQAAQQLRQITALLKHAADITSQVR